MRGNLANIKAGFDLNFVPLLFEMIYSSITTSLNKKLSCTSKAQWPILRKSRVKHDFFVTSSRSSCALIHISNNFWSIGISAEVGRIGISCSANRNDRQCVDWFQLTNRTCPSLRLAHEPLWKNGVRTLILPTGSFWCCSLVVPIAMDSLGNVALGLLRVKFHAHPVLNNAWMRR